MTSAFVNPSWMPHSVGEAARGRGRHRGRPPVGTCVVPLARRPAQGVRGGAADAGRHNAADMAAGFRHLLVLLGIGLDNALREESGSVLAVKPSSVDSIYKWGMDCPDCIYTGAGLRGGETYRLWGNRGTARYVGLQSMAGMASSANVLLDELDLGPDGEVDLILSAEHHDGNWLRSPTTPPHWWSATSSMTGTRRWRPRSPSSGSGGKGRRRRVPAEDPRAVVARQLIALGDFVVANLEFFLQFARPEKPNTFMLPSTGRRWARRRRTARSSGPGRSPPTRRWSWRSHPPGPLLELLARETPGGRPSTTAPTRAA